VIGTTLAHYRITAALGAGGMGEVWRATDEKLGREVALKVLPAEFAADPQRLDRFEREARAVAALNHPHIVTIYSVEEAEGTRFLTMELIDGKSLDHLIPDGGLDLGRFLELATPLAEAIAAAHDKSVIHRDLKPTNVMVDRDGRVKVMDFGLAKMTSAEDPSDSSELPTEALTGIGMIVGTVPYMSPEQIEGEIVDHRTDIFSLGVLLYEMALGERPFQGKSSPALMSSILKDVPSSVVEIRDDLPRHLGRVIGRCLEKDRRDRYQTARDVFNELKALRRESTTAAPAGVAHRTDPSPSATMRSSSEVGASISTRRDEGFWVAVLPFKCTGGDSDLAALAEGLNEDIVTGLSRFSYLRVIARDSAALRSGEMLSSVGGEIEASYVMEGGLRRSGARLRIAVQLIEATTGAHLWAETYDRTFSPEALFELQDDLVPRIVSTVADMHGILPRRMSETVRRKPADQLTPYEALLHSFGYNERFTPEALAEARSCLERAVEQSPGNADCWAMLSLMYSNEYGHWDIRNPESFDKALRAARKAVLAAPLHSLPHYALAQAHFFRREFPEARNAAERAVALNPMDGATAAFMGLLIAYSGDWDRGCPLAQRALEMNPNLPGMYNYTAWHDAYRKEDYSRALELALRLNTPENFYQHAVLTMCYAQLGEMDAAHKSLQDMLAIKPDYGQVARRLHGKWIQPDLVEKLMDGLRKAGLEIADEGDTADSPPVPPASGEQRAAGGFWVAVLPFTYSGGDADVAALAEGLGEEIVSGLSRFSYLRVMATATAGVDARYVLEGSLRKAGTKVRLAIKLVDNTAGTHLWAENYERTFSVDALFELQDELGSQIASTVGDAHGVLPHTMSESLRDRQPDELTPYEAVLRAFGQGFRRTPEEHETVRAGLERAVERSPRFADAWAMLAFTYVDEQSHGYNQRPDSLDRALDAAQRAVDAAPSNAMAYHALAWAMYFRKELGAFRTAADRSIALNPLNSPTLAGLGALIAYAGDWERGCGLVERAVALNPRHPGWYWFPLFYDAYRKGDYRDAVAIAFKINLPKFFVTHEALAAAYGQLGEEEAAAEALAEMLRLKPDYAETGRARLENWFDQDMVEHLFEGLQKAGLYDPSPAHSKPRAPAAGDSQSSVSASLRRDEGFWVGVLPFKNRGSDDDLEALAGGLTEDIVTGMSRFSYLRVVSHGSIARFGDSSVEVALAGDQLGARYILEGSLRKAGSKLRVAVKLVDTVTGAHLWAEAYDRDFEPDDLFSVQDDLVPRIVSTCADHFGVLARAISEVVRGKPIAELTPYEALMRGFGYHFRLSSDEHAQAREALVRAVEQDPANADCQAMLAWVWAHEVAHGFNPRPGSLDRALAAAKKAVDLAPSNHLAQQVLAVVLFFRGDIAACRSACERALALNPLDGSNEAMFLTCFTGDWERGCALIRRAMELNPHHPRWYCAVLALDHYRRKDYRAAADAAIEANAVDLFWTHWLLAAAYAQLGEMEAARRALDDLLALKPDFAETGGEILSLWFEPDLAEHFKEGLRKAGLSLRPAPFAERRGVSRSSVGTAPSPTADTKSIVVLPFSNLSPDPDDEYFSDGLTDEIITDLSRVRALRVISRSSAMRLKGDDRGLADIGRDLDCRYVLEGSVRRAANNLRITARLVDAPDDVQLWADKYAGSLDDVFDIQERVSRSIVDALEIRLTPHEAAQLAERPIDDVRAQESYLRARNEIWSFMPSGLERAISHLESAVELIGDNALIYQGLGEAYFQYVNIGAATGREEELIRKAEGCADKIFALEPESPRGHLVRGQVQMARGEIHGCAGSFQRVLLTYPNEVMALALYTHLLGWLSGKAETAAPYAARLAEIDPLNPMSLLVRAMVPMFAGRFDEAVDATQRMFDLDPVTPVWRANHVMALSYARRLDEAEALTEAIDAQPDSDVGTWQMGLNRAAWRSDRAEVLRLTDGPYRQVAEWDAEVPWFLAVAHAAVGEKDEALLWLDRAVDRGMINYPFLSEHDWYLDGIRGDERFGRVMERARREWERLDEVLP